MFIIIFHRISHHLIVLVDESYVGRCIRDIHQTGEREVQVIFIYLLPDIV